MRSEGIEMGRKEGKLRQRGGCLRGKRKRGGGYLGIERARPFRASCTLSFTQFLLLFGNKLYVADKTYIHLVNFLGKLKIESSIFGRPTPTKNRVMSKLGPIPPAEGVRPPPWDPTPPTPLFRILPCLLRPLSFVLRLYPPF